MQHNKNPHLPKKDVSKEQKDKKEDISDAQYGRDQRRGSFVSFEKSGSVYYANPEESTSSVFRKFQNDKGQKIGVKVQAMDRHEIECWNIAYPNSPAKYVEFIDPGTKNKSVRAVFPVVEGVPLKDYLKLYKDNKQKILEIFLECALALRHLHKNLAHGDLHYENFLVKENDGKFDVNIIDFGNAKTLVELRDSKEQQKELNFDISKLWYIFLNHIKDSSLTSNIASERDNVNDRQFSLDRMIEKIQKDLSIMNKDNKTNQLENITSKLKQTRP